MLRSPVEKNQTGAAASEGDAQSYGRDGMLQQQEASELARNRAQLDRAESGEKHEDVILEDELRH